VTRVGGRWSGLKLVCDQMAAPVLEMMDGSLFIRTSPTSIAHLGLLG
jgi:hypothetical protein